MLASLCFSCPRCLLLRRGSERWAFGSLSRQLAGNSSKDTAGGKDTASSSNFNGNKDNADKSKPCKETTISAKDKNSKGKKPIKDIELPPEPTTCCMSGCANCVWVDYALTLAKLLGDNDEAARELVLSKITDPNLKMFLSLELRQMARQREEKAAADKAAAAKPKK